MRIVVDAMGSDACPAPDVAGAVAAARETKDMIILVGPEQIIKRELEKHHSMGLKIEIAHADDVIRMDDKPGEVCKSKPNSSLHVGMNLVKQGNADAFVTAGNTGAVYAVAMLSSLGRIPGVKRPALSAIFPVNDRPVTFLDIGANADSKPEWLAQFAVMGRIYAQHALGLDNPRVGLLSNGEEETKGSQLIQEASAMIRELPLNYVGNVEPKEMLQNFADVVVTDGFTGNILVKTFEASTRYLTQIIRCELEAGWLSKLGALLARPAFRRVRRKIDTSEIGGAPLLGVAGVVIIGHGRSDDKAIKNAVYQARKAVEGQVVETIKGKVVELSHQS